LRITESLLIKEGRTDRVGEKPKTRCKSGFIEHLREREGPDEVAATGTIETPWKRLKSASPPSRV
jgi:hypothetical protein